MALGQPHRIAALYVIETNARGMWPEASHTIDARTQWRQEQAQPLLDSMHDWLRQTRVMVANGSGLAKAMALWP